ncbi:MAG TPA: biopolymer transporter ExbD [candidate division Zixibacteria bacterium]|nr:biopolymer transporter ExbD [candidate division Zixibacteria bacterium]MDD4918118.1 biopolymer transporter ExbD [candidate division Zixibacteria bacterium]MDM7972061.1 biopolymer transporter ExbD [candidate division Zixibacteria bacterium]HOD67617.1 biopolymer transporter ExbD [candidate division Zixibacteria bacterium]HPC11110.1 biopolymer transporter ExbD [candidate division Zixibacteria bacterium]
MAGEVVQREAKGKKKGLRRQKRRIAIRIDMTPMVDIAFLLLIFYMVSTVFSMPQAMEINLPPAEQMDQEIEVKESNLLTIRVDGQGRYWWNLKTPTPDNLPLLLPPDPQRPDTIPYRLWEDTLRGLLVNQNRLNPKLNTLILIHKDGSYADMVDILDEIDLIERSWNEYQAKKLRKKLDELSKDEKFSYRYAIGEWMARDDKVQEAAEAQARLGGLL